MNNNYKRNIDRRLLILRLLFLVLVTGCIGSFAGQQEGLGYLLAIILLTLNFIVITGLTVRNGSCCITKYYAFALIKQTWRFNEEENIRISSLDPDFGQDTDMPDTTAEPEVLGCLWTFFAAFIPSKVTKRRIKIEKLDDAGKPINRVGILLKSQEFKYIEQFIE